MLIEFAYCPRLFHLMHVEGRWADNVIPSRGNKLTGELDKLDHVLPDPEASLSNQPDVSSVTARFDDDEPPTVTRSVPLSSDRLRITAKLDLVSSDGREAVPVETKRGRVPNNDHRSWEPERVQLMAQGLLCANTATSATTDCSISQAPEPRVDVPFTTELEALTLSLIEEARQSAYREKLPPPLEDSPKCIGCSLNGICLPDETLALQQVPADPIAPAVRRLYPAAMTPFHCMYRSRERRSEKPQRT